MGQLHLRQACVQACSTHVFSERTDLLDDLLTVCLGHSVIIHG